jgi:hypothetical protein
LVNFSDIKLSALYTVGRKVEPKSLVKGIYTERGKVSPFISMKMETEPQGEAIDKWVEDLGESECRLVMSCNGADRGSNFALT